MESVDRLHMNQVYPIVLLIKFKSVKQIKEVKDSHRWSGLGGNPATGAGSSGVGLHAGLPGHGSDKISQKDAKTIFEHAQKLEAEYKHLISGTHVIHQNTSKSMHLQISYLYISNLILDTIHAGANLMLMCAQIENKIHQEQSKTLWVPSGTIW